MDESEEFEWCFNNFEGITTTMPGGVGNIFRKFEIFVIVFIGFVNIFMNFVN